MVPCVRFHTTVQLRDRIRLHLTATVTNEADKCAHVCTISLDEKILRNCSSL